MFNIRDGKGSGRTLRRMWYLTNDAQAQLRSRWTFENHRAAAKDVCFAVQMERNQLVTKACETETSTEFV